MITSGVQLIGISGKAGSGKTTAALHLHKTRACTWVVHLADPLKKAAAAMFGISINDFYDSELKEEYDQYWHRTPRQIAQFFGTEMVRNTIIDLLPTVGTTFWIKRLEGLLNNELLDDDGYEVDYGQEDVVVVPDIRFQEEADWILNSGGILINITRPGTAAVGLPGHASEAGFSISAINGGRYYEVRNTGTEEELLATIDGIVSSAGLYPFAEEETDPLNDPENF